MKVDKPATYTNERILDAGDTNAHEGTVSWNPGKSLWFFSMLFTWVVFGSLYFTWSAAGLFLITSAVTIWGGHSLGMHHKLIHDSFDCPPLLEKAGVYLGTLVGLGGPFTMTHTHDIRDWAQRQSACHDYFNHNQTILKDAWWQIHCSIALVKPPKFDFPAKLQNDHYYRMLQHTSILQQLPWAILFFLIGGWGWVAWGICGRIVVSITGHWLIGYFAHNRGQRDWHVSGAAAQGYNIRWCGLITCGECWHNNHHAFPGSAKLGLRNGQTDPGWWVLKTLERAGLVSNLKEPRHLVPRDELKRLSP